MDYCEPPPPPYCPPPEPEPCNPGYEPEPCYVDCEPPHQPPGQVAKGNNGVGNGEDPQPPGNPPINDGPGTGPGQPGNRPMGAGGSFRFA